MLRIRSWYGPLTPGLAHPGSRVTENRPGGCTDMAPFPGSLPAHDIAMTDLTLMGNRTAHADNYIEEGSVSITFSGRYFTMREV
jgi:hypothetical protein